MIKKWYLSTPMNGKTEKEIQAALQRGVNWCIKNNDEFCYPYNPDNAEFTEGKLLVTLLSQQSLLFKELLLPLQKEQQQLQPQLQMVKLQHA